MLVGMTELVVAVCTNRSPAEVADCLAALLPQAEECEVLLAVNGSEGLVAAHRAAISELDSAENAVTVLPVPQVGLSHARNAVLARCRDEQIVAFIDDDAVVMPNWRERLHAAWRSVPPAVACIGGPIAPRFAAPRPKWLSDRLLPALTVLNYGLTEQDLDPNVRSIYGANMSFRCGLLRSEGGFNPRFGHVGRRLWFAEEDEVQRALFAAGYKVLYVPGVQVEHLIPAARMRRASFLQRRFRYGATLGARRARNYRVALRQCARSIVGLPIALIGGDVVLTMERATRVAENLGVLVAPLLKQ